MALPITVKADYKGRIRISTQKGSQLDEYITEFEKVYIKQFFNDDIYVDIKDTDPLPQKYLDLINGVEYTDSDGDLVDYEGFKDALLRLIYAKYMSDNFQTSIAGNVRSLNENSDVLTAGNTVIIALRYNEAIRKYRSGVVKFLEEHKVYTPDITQTGSDGTTTTVSVASTKYLSDGDTVTIEGVDYVVSNVVTDVSFDVLAGFFVVNAGDYLIYEPFYGVNYKNISYLGVI